MFRFPDVVKEETQLVGGTEEDAEDRGGWKWRKKKKIFIETYENM